MRTRKEEENKMRLEYSCSVAASIYTHPIHIPQNKLEHKRIHWHFSMPSVEIDECKTHTHTYIYIVKDAWIIHAMALKDTHACTQRCCLSIATREVYTEIVFYPRVYTTNGKYFNVDGNFLLAAEAILFLARAFHFLIKLCGISSKNKFSLRKRNATHTHTPYTRTKRRRVCINRHVVVECCALSNNSREYTFVYIYI